MNEKPRPTEESAPESPTPRQRRILRTQDVLAGHSEITLLHGSEEYRLRVTRQGKLILTK